MRLTDNLLLYLEARLEGIKLEAMLASRQMMARLVVVLALSALGLLVLLFLSLAGAWALGGWLGHMGLGLLAVGGVYVVLLLILYLARKPAERWLITHMQSFLEGADEAIPSALPPATDQDSPKVPDSNASP